MKKVKRFLRFVIEENGSGKIRAMSYVNKIFENDVFVEMDGGYIFAKPDRNQIEIDIENANMKDYPLLKYYEHSAGKIVKRSQANITQIDQEYQAVKQQKMQALDIKNEEIEDAKEIIADESKSLQKRVDAMAELIRLKGV